MGYQEEAAEKKRKNKESLKEVCATLFNAGITLVEVHYDGYGDSGQIEYLLLFKGDKQLTDEEVVSLGLPTSTIQEYNYKSTGDKDRYITKECTLVDKIEDCAYDFLPGGWEINEGSFGDLKINTETAKATLEHNFRIQETEYSEEEFDL
jgi:hypothetical protein